MKKTSTGSKVSKTLAVNSSPAMPAAPPSSGDFRAVPSEPKQYALNDEQYAEWKSALASLRKDPEQVEPLRQMACKSQSLLNWRSPVNGQTLLHAMVEKGASDTAIADALQMGCQSNVINDKGETATTLAERKQLQRSSLGTKAQVSVTSSYGGMRARTNGGSRAEGRNVSRRASTDMPIAVRQALDRQRTGQAQDTSQLPLMVSQTVPPSFGVSQMSSGIQKQRKAGQKLCRNETASVPKAKLNVEMDLQTEGAGELDRDQLEQSIRKAYGGKARVQIDEVCESASKPRSETARWQKVSCRVMYDDVEEAKTWQNASSTLVTSQVAADFQLAPTAVALDEPATIAEVDAITLKLDSDSASILCGACLMCDKEGECKKVVHYADRRSQDGSVFHSGDTKVDGKSVHTLGVMMSRVPDEITQLYFTLCSCGPATLSGFKEPSIMLYDNGEPDANLLEYSISQAADSPSSTMARMVRQPVWNAGDKAVIAHVLRKMRMPLLCIDLVLAMGMETSWSIQALGSDEWNMQDKICGNYGPAKALVKKNFSNMTSVNADVRSVGVRRSTGNATSSSTTSA